MTTRRFSRTLLVATVLLSCPAAAVAQSTGDSAAREVAAVPNAFIKNAGQWQTPAQFVALSGGFVTRLEPASIVVQIDDRSAGCGRLIRLTFEGCEPACDIRGEGRLTPVYHYFLGADPARWHHDVPLFSSVLYSSLYPGVDMRVRAGSLGEVAAYDMLLQPGADLERIVIRVDGADGIRLEGDGSLVIETDQGSLHQPPPTTWWVTPDGVPAPAPSAFRVLDTHRYGFKVPQAPADVSTVIDPGLEWSSYLGGTTWEDEPLTTIAADGSVIVAGCTVSPDFPVTPGAYDLTFIGNFCDAFVSSFTPDGTQLEWSTFIGGDNVESPVGIGTRSDGSIVIVGQTASLNYPTTPGAFDQLNATQDDAFVTALAPDGAGLIYSTFLGDIGPDWPQGMAILDDETVVIAGYTHSAAFPVTPGAFDTIIDVPTGDGFVSRLAADRGSLLASTFLGGTGNTTDLLYGIGVGPDGSVAVVGKTSSPDFPVTPGAFDTTTGGEYVAKFDPTLSNLVFASYIGGNQPERLTQVAVDTQGAVTVGGWTKSPDWPVTAGAFSTRPTGGAAENVVTTFTPSGNALIASTFLGGSGQDNLLAMELDSGGVVTVAGLTKSTFLFPVTAGTYDDTANGDWDLYIGRLSPDLSQLWYLTYLGGSQEEGSLGADDVDIALSPDGSVTVASRSESADYPTTPGAFDTTLDAVFNTVVTKLSMLPTGVDRYGVSTPGCDGYQAIGVTAQARVAEAFGLTCTNAPALETQGLLVIGFGALTNPLSVKGAGLWVDPSPTLLFLPAGADQKGFAWLPFVLPNDPALVGASFTAQFFWPDPCAQIGTFSASNALSVSIQP